MSEKNYILRENATTQKIVFMDACTHTMGRLTALGSLFCDMAWYKCTVKERDKDMHLSAALTVTVSEKNSLGFWW